MKLISCAAFVGLLFIAACTASPTVKPASSAPTAVVLAPSSTRNAPATETAVAARIYATLTASAPTQDNATAPIPTLSNNLSPSVTPLPIFPTARPTKVLQTSTAAPPEISREALRGKILFKSTQNGGKYPNNFKWFVMNGNGSDVRQVDATKANALYRQLKPLEGYSPDKSSLVVGEVTCPPNGHCDLYIGAPEVAMSRSQGQWTPGGPSWYRADNPAWSPDGSWIAFVWNRDNDRTKNIFQGQPFEKNPAFERLTDFGGGRDTKDPTYSPDGASIAFATQDGSHWQIWVLDATANDAGAAKAHAISDAMGNDWDPLWIK